jgi:carboxylate-amine ligase
MSTCYRIPAVGVEEEYQLVAPETGELSPVGRAVLLHASGTTDSSIQHELHLEQIEMASPILYSSEEVRKCLRDTRAALMEAARASSTVLVAAGTNPMALPTHVITTPNPRYTRMERQYQALARELVIFGCHVHVDMPDRAMGIQVQNYLRVWLPLLQAMSANSPFWHGEDTGYDSFRREVWVQWPMSGVPHFFKDLQDFNDCVQCLIQTGAIDDETKIYWDARLPVKTPTLEFRVFDVQTEIEDCVALVAISRALTMQCEYLIAAGDPVPQVRHEVLRSAIWRAARYGLRSQLVDPCRSTLDKAFNQVETLIDFISEPLRVLGDLDLVHDYVARLRQTGTPAERQRAALRDSGGHLKDVVCHLADRTLPQQYRLAPADQT